MTHADWIRRLGNLADDLHRILTDELENKDDPPDTKRVDGLHAALAIWARRFNHERTCGK